MTSRARLSRRPLQVGGLLLATVALGTVTAPAASAMVDPNAPADQTPEQAPAPAPVVLTNSPASYLGTPDEPVQFGLGKQQISVVPAQDVDAPEDEDLSGAQIRITIEDFERGETELTCTTDTAGICTFDAEDYENYYVDSPQLLSIDLAEYTVELITAPDSGVLGLPVAEEDTVVHGRGGPFDRLDSAAPPRGATAPVVTWASSSGVGGADVTGTLVFQLPLATTSAGQTGGTPVAGGAPAPDSTAPAAPVVPAVPSAATPAATAAPTLATTGFDAVPAALVGGGLLAAGAGAVALGRRRAAR